MHKESFIAEQTEWYYRNTIIFFCFMPTPPAIVC